VKDTGIGVPHNRQQAIFNRFEQADIEDTRAFQGSGLGLSISKAYTEMLGGKIWLTSEQGKGSTFRFTIPYDSKEKTTVEPKAKATVARQKENTDTNRQLLIVEDEETSSLYLETILKDTFAKITFAKTGKEAVEICRNNSTIDIILMDIKMPEMNGYEATREIRKFNKNVIIIAQTAHALAGDKTKVLEAGCNDYISKPINKTILYDIIKKYY
jgi:CheY-like chemotaxis protein